MTKIKKEFLYTLTVGGFYSWNVYRITDAAKYSYFVAHPVNHGASVLTEVEAEIKPKLEQQAKWLTEFLSKVK